MTETATRSYNLQNFGAWADMGQHKHGSIPGKAFVQSALGTTSCEISLNRAPAGAGMPFLHAHRQNEEVYIVVSGNGIFHLDGEEIAIQEGSVIRVAPSVARGYVAGSEDLCFICVQAREGSLTDGTTKDGFRLEAKASWM